MPIKIPDHLPARAILEREGVMVMEENQAGRQDIRPLRIALVNLMPNKIRTETQFARLLGATPLQVELTLLCVSQHTSKNTSAEHMLAFYQPWESVKYQKFDGLIITGAPVELMDFENVDYWQELTEIFAWSQTHVHQVMAVCWAAQAALWHFHAIVKHALPAKAFGIYRHRIISANTPYLRGFSDDFQIPVSRWTESRRSDIPPGRGLDILVESDEAGLCLIHDAKRRILCMLNHVEYDTTSLQEEYIRDLQKNPSTPLPVQYFPQDIPHAPPENRWRSHAHLLFGNWINEIYQTTPFDLERIRDL